MPSIFETFYADTHCLGVGGTYLNLLYTEEYFSQTVAGARPGNIGNILRGKDKAV